jgi:peroxiredoxin
MLDRPRSDLVLDPGGPKAPAVTFTALDGRTARLNSPEGAGIVLVFVSTWCPSCAAEATAWSRAAAERESVGVAIYVVDIDPFDTPGSLAGFRDQYGLGNLRFVLDEQQELARALGLPGMDATIAVAGDGRIVYTDQGLTPRATVEALIAALR